MVLRREEQDAARSFANLPHVAAVPADQLTAYDVLSADCVIFTDATLPGESYPVVEGSSSASSRPRRAAATGRATAGLAEAGPVTGPAIDTTPPSDGAEAVVVHEDEVDDGAEAPSDETADAVAGADAVADADADAEAGADAVADADAEADETEEA